MKSRHQLISVGLILAALAACDLQEPTTLAPPEAALEAESAGVDSRFLVEYSGPLEPLIGEVNMRGGEVGRIHASIGVLEVEGLTADVLTALPGVKHATPDLATELVQEYPIERPIDFPWWSVVAYELDPASQASTDPADAFFYDCQWNLAQVEAERAWAAGARGAGIKVAILDTGVDPDHIDLAGKIDLEQSTSFLTYEGQVCPQEDRTTFVDHAWHGTAVSGFITTNNVGVAGVAPDASIVMVKVIGCDGGGYFGDILAGLMYAAELDDVEVISISLGWFEKRGSPGSDRFMAVFQKAANHATQQGKLVVGTAMNWGMNLDKTRDNVAMPGSLANVRAVYATNHRDQLASYSNYGVANTWVGAPSGEYADYTDAPWLGCPAIPAVQARVPLLCSGHSVDPLFSEACGGSNSSYLYFAAGTSFATPLVAGIAALVDGTRGGGFRPQQLATILAQTAEDLGDPGVDTYYSHGRVNAARAVGRR